MPAQGNEKVSAQYFAAVKSPARWALGVLGFAVIGLLWTAVSNHAEGQSPLVVLCLVGAVPFLLLLLHVLLLAFARGPQLVIDDKGVEYRKARLSWNEVGRVWTGQGVLKYWLMIETTPEAERRITRATNWIFALWTLGSIGIKTKRIGTNSATINLAFLDADPAGICQAIEGCRPPQVGESKLPGTSLDDAGTCSATGGGRLDTRPTATLWAALTALLGYPLVFMLVFLASVLLIMIVAWLWAGVPLNTDWSDAFAETEIFKLSVGVFWPLGAMLTAALCVTLTGRLFLRASRWTVALVLTVAQAVLAVWLFSSGAPEGWIITLSPLAGATVSFFLLLRYARRGD